MTFKSTKKAIAAGCLFLFGAAGAVHGQVAGDVCATAIQASGDASINLDMAQMTQTDGFGWIGSDCFETNVGHEIDAYICWSPTFDGVVEISTCGATQMDTQIAFFEGCICPDELSVPLCCDDNVCGKQTSILCDVQCGMRYTILVSVAGVTQPSDFDLSIVQIGDPCDSPVQGEDITCEDCCGGVPEVTGFTGLQAISTQWRDVPNDYVVNVYDLNPAGLSAPGSNSTPPVYQHPDWTRDQLGTVFGCAIGGDGTMYVSATSIFFLDDVGSLGSAGSIYRLDGVTGAPSELIALPNQFSNGYPSLGNIAFDCEKNALYASNFDDGLIWSVDPSSGAPIDTYRHASQSVLGPAGDPNDAPGYAPLGERVWAVQPVGDRLYYSVWVEDQGRPNVNRNNEVWSVGLNAFGGFVAGTTQFEFSTPDYIANEGNNASSPVSDLTQGPDCCLYLAERSMTSDSNGGSHESRLIVACQDENGAWSLDEDAYQVGEIPDSSTGGVAVDFIDGGNVWVTADAALFSGGAYAYGIQGTPRPGGDYTTSVQIDLDQDVISQDKGQIGSLEITCIMEATGPCMTSSLVGGVECIVDENGLTGEYAIQVEVINWSSNDVHYLMIPDASVSPNMIPFSPMLSSGQSMIVDLVVTGSPYEWVCVPLVFFDVEGEECCTSEVCFELPECDCAILNEVSVECSSSVAGVLEVSFTLTNLTADVIEHVFVLPDPGSGTIITPSHIDVPSLPPFGTIAIGPVEIQTAAAPGDLETLFIGLHNAQFNECCAEPLVFDVPDCGAGMVLGDLNSDGLVDGMDMAVLIGSWGTSGPGDLNGDGVVDGQDLAILLSVWGGVTTSFTSCRTIRAPGFRRARGDVAELAYAADSKSASGNGVRVRVPPSLLNSEESSRTDFLASRL